jgi:hypothetical protein
MKATLLLRERIAYPDGALIEMKIWQVTPPVPPTTHGLKYSLVYIVAGERVVGYDCERGKGDHRHIEGGEIPYRFVDSTTLIADFRADVVNVRGSI